MCEFNDTFGLIKIWPPVKIHQHTDFRFKILCVWVFLGTNWRILFDLRVIGGHVALVGQNLSTSLSAGWPQIGSMGPLVSKHPQRLWPSFLINIPTGLSTYPYLPIYTPPLLVAMFWVKKCSTDTWSVAIFLPFGELGGTNIMQFVFLCKCKKQIFMFW